MWSTFLTTLRINLREKSSLFWLFCFPILLSTMFLGMFGNLGATYEVTTMRFAMVANGDYCKSEGAQQLVAAMQRTPVTPQACDTAPDAMDVDSGVTDLRDLLDVTPVDNAAEATDLINTDTDVRGFLTVDGDGLLHMTISRATVSSVNDTMSTPGLPVSLSILDGAIGMFNRQALTVAQIMSSDPAVFTNEAFTAAVQEAPGFTRQVRLTNFKPDESARYYYALLAMTALMAMTFAVTTVCSTQANLSALGMRRSLAPLTRFRQLMGGFLASWLCTFCSLLVALLVHPLRLSHLVRWPLGGHTARDRRRIVCIERARHIARITAETDGQHKNRPDDRHLMRALIAQRPVRLRRDGVERLDPTQRADRRNDQPHPAGDQPVLRHPLLRLICPILPHRRHPADDGRSRPGIGDRVPQEATLCTPLRPH